MTEFVYIKGKTKWFKHINPDVFNKPDGTVQESWKHTIWPDNESLEIVRKLQAQGVKNTLKLDDDGYYITFNRPTKIKRNGQWIKLDPPLVLLNDNKTQFADMLGHGSDITTKLEVYEHGIPGSSKKAKAARWLSTRIDHLVPYTPNIDQNSNYTANEQRAMKGFEGEAPANPGF